MNTISILPQDAGSRIGRSIGQTAVRFHRVASHLSPREMALFGAVTEFMTTFLSCPHREESFAADYHCRAMKESYFMTAYFTGVLAIAGLNLYLQNRRYRH